MPIGKVVHLIFRGVATSTSKRQDKLTLREIMATEPTTPRYMDWSEYPIQFTREDQWTTSPVEYKHGAHKHLMASSVQTSLNTMSKPRASAINGGLTNLNTSRSTYANR